MKERGGVLAALLTGLLLYFWLRFPVHVDPRFPGSLAGGALAVTGSMLLLVPLAYTVGKRLLRMRGQALRTFLTLHIYAALVGAILVVIHTGHKFDNPLGVLLTAMVLVVVLSGFVGRYLLQVCTQHLSARRDDLARAETAISEMRDEFHRQAERVGPGAARRAAFLTAFLPWVVRDPELRATSRRVVALAEAMATMDTSVVVHERFRGWFRLWMRFHLTLTAVFYLLLAAHVLAVSYYGLRWLPE